VEVKLRDGEEWLAVCSDNWSIKEAMVICRQLGFRETLGAPSNYKVGDTKVEKLDIVCDGQEETIGACQVTLATGACTEDGVVGAYCSTASAEDTTEDAEETKTLLDSLLHTSGLRTREIAAKWHLNENFDTAECEILPGIPLPFSKDLVTEAFVYPEDVFPLYEDMDQKLRLNLCNPVDGRGLKIQRGLQEMVDAGLKWNMLGMDLSVMLKNGSLNYKKENIDLLHELYFQFNEHDLLHWDLDFGHQINQFISNNKVDDIDGLHRDGFLRVEDFGLDLDVLPGLVQRSSDLFKATETTFNENHDAWVSVTSNGTVSTARLLLPELEPFITNKNFQDILKDYLGTSIKLDGYKLTKLNPAVTSDMENSYVASRWHHDRTGRRIKLFVFLHDIDCAHGHPTKVAIGTHNLVYYRTETFPLSRYTEKFVLDNYKIVEGCGKKGGGFIFDTHTIHRGTPEGEDSRTTLIMEYHNSVKCSIARELGLGLPCPSGDQYIVNRVI